MSSLLKFAKKQSIDLKAAPIIFVGDSIPFNLQKENAAFAIKSSKQLSSEISVSLFKQYREALYFNGAQKAAFVQPWMPVMLVLLFAGLAYSKSVYNKRFNLLALTFINWKVAKSIIRFEKVYFHPVNIILNSIFVLSATLFLCLGYAFKYSFEPVNSQLFFNLLAPLLPLLLLRLTVYKFSAWLISMPEGIEEFLFQANLFNKILGLGFLIINCLLLFSKINTSVLFSGGIVLFVLLFIMLLIRGILIGREMGIHLLVIILYLCTLEILPWLILIKLVKTVI